VLLIDTLFKYTHQVIVQSQFKLFNGFELTSILLLLPLKLPASFVYHFSLLTQVTSVAVQLLLQAVSLALPSSKYSATNQSLGIV
jgi:hypothetical protein